MDLEPSDVEAWIRTGGARERRWCMATKIYILAAAIGGIVVIASCLITIRNLSEADYQEHAIAALRDRGWSNVRLGDPDPEACDPLERSQHFWARRGDRVARGTMCGCNLILIGKQMFMQPCKIRWPGGLEPPRTDGEK